MIMVVLKNTTDLRKYCMLFPFISTSSRIIVNGTKQLLVAIRYLFLTKKLAEEILIGFEEELWMLTFYLVLHYVIRS